MLPWEVSMTVPSRTHTTGVKLTGPELWEQNNVHGAWHWQTWLHITQAYTSPSAGPGARLHVCWITLPTYTTVLGPLLDGLLVSGSHVHHTLTPAWMGPP